MLKKTITFKNFNGEEVTKEYRFHLSQAKLLELNLTRKGGLGAYIQELANADEAGKILEILTKMIKMSVGKVSPDGNQFIDTEDVQNEFMRTPAFDVLLMELASDETGVTAAAFINGIAPKGLDEAEFRTKLEEVRANVEAKQPKTVDESSITREVIAKQQEARAGHPEADPTATDPTGLTGPRHLTAADILEMDQGEVRSGIAEGRYVIG